MRTRDVTTPRRGPRRSRVLPALAVAAVVTLVLAFVVGYPIAVYASARDVTVTVNKTERVCDSTTSSKHGSNGQKCQYLVYTYHGTFKDTDSLLYLKFDSSDLYGRLMAGHRYRLHVTGFRLPFASAYPNVVRETEVS